jgi:phosphoribosyl 1,2-cyclic phosphate phosphodiesterase
MTSTLTFLGTGTSMGVPTLGCACAVCRSAVAPAGTPGADPRNRRTRPSIRLAFNHKVVLIDTGPDFHAQALREQLTQVDAVFYTHHHADHILGMDDLRPLSFRSPEPIPLFADPATEAVLRRVFHYTFRTDAEGRYATSARVRIVPLPAPGTEIPLFGAVFQPIPIIHGRETVTGYRFGAAAYLTDMSDIPAESLPLLQNLDILILDALRPTPHPSHSHLAKSIAFVEQLQPKRAFFTHMSHELDHAATEAILPPHIRLAYDGLQLTFAITPEENPESAA